MAKQLGKLKMIPVNKTVVFWSPIEGDDVLVRTGTIAEGSCFFHSLLYAHSREYVAMNTKERMKFVRRLRASMAGKVDKESWEDMGKGLIAKIPFQEKVNDILVNFYHFLHNDNRARGRSTRKVIKNLVGDDAQQLELFKIITELVPIEEFEQKILPTAYHNSEDQKISDTCDCIIKETNDYLNNIEEFKSIDKEKSDYISNIVNKFLCEVLREAEDSSFKEYIKGLENVAEDVDTYTIELISERFNRDVYFLDGKNRMPYNNSSTSENLKGRKSIIVLWIGGNHYEIVGRLLPGNRIQREFSHDDPLIEKLYTFLIKPSEIKHKYTELVPYLPREFRDDETPSPRRFTDTDSVSGDESSSSLSDDDYNYYGHSSEEDE